MKIIIAGAGAVGTHLAKLLSGEKQDIILMDAIGMRTLFASCAGTGILLLAFL